MTRRKAKQRLGGVIGPRIEKEGGVKKIARMILLSEEKVAALMQGKGRFQRDVVETLVVELKVPMEESRKCLTAIFSRQARHTGRRWRKSTRKRFFAGCANYRR